MYEVLLAYTLVPHMRVWYPESTEESWIPSGLELQMLMTATWVLATEPGSSTAAASAPNPLDEPNLCPHD